MTNQIAINKITQQLTNDAPEKTLEAWLQLTPRVSSTETLLYYYDAYLSSTGATRLANMIELSRSVVARVRSTLESVYLSLEYRGCLKFERAALLISNAKNLTFQDDISRIECLLKHFHQQQRPQSSHIELEVIRARIEAYKIVKKYLQELGKTGDIVEEKSFKNLSFVLKVLQHFRNFKSHLEDQYENLPKDGQAEALTEALWALTSGLFHALFKLGLVGLITKGELLESEGQSLLRLSWGRGVDDATTQRLTFSAHPFASTYFRRDDQEDDARDSFEVFLRPLSTQGELSEGYRWSELWSLMESTDAESVTPWTSLSWLPVSLLSHDKKHLPSSLIGDGQPGLSLQEVKGVPSYHARSRGLEGGELHIDQRLEELIKSDNKRLINLYGVEGVGKSTLALHIHNKNLTGELSDDADQIVTFYVDLKNKDKDKDQTDRYALIKTLTKLIKYSRDRVCLIIDHATESVWSESKELREALLSYLDNKLANCLIISQSAVISHISRQNTLPEHIFASHELKAITPEGAGDFLQRAEQLNVSADVSAELCRLTGGRPRPLTLLAELYTSNITRTQDVAFDELLAPGLNGALTAGELPKPYSIELLKTLIEKLTKLRNEALTETQHQGTTKEDKALIASAMERVKTTTSALATLTMLQAWSEQSQGGAKRSSLRALDQLNVELSARAQALRHFIDAKRHQETAYALSKVAKDLASAKALLAEHPSRKLSVWVDVTIGELYELAQRVGYEGLEHHLDPVNLDALKLSELERFVTPPMRILSELRALYRSQEGRDELRLFLQEHETDKAALEIELGYLSRESFQHIHLLRRKIEQVRASEAPDELKRHALTQAVMILADEAPLYALELIHELSSSKDVRGPKRLWLSLTRYRLLMELELEEPQESQDELRGELHELTQTLTEDEGDPGWRPVIAEYLAREACRAGSVIEPNEWEAWRMSPQLSAYQDVTLAYVEASELLEEAQQASREYLEAEATWRELEEDDDSEEWDLRAAFDQSIEKLYETQKFMQQSLHALEEVAPMLKSLQGRRGVSSRLLIIGHLVNLWHFDLDIPLYLLPADIEESFVSKLQGLLIDVKNSMFTEAYRGELLPRELRELLYWECLTYANLSSVDTAKRKEEQEWVVEYSKIALEGDSQVFDGTQVTFKGYLSVHPAHPRTFTMLSQRVMRLDGLGQRAQAEAVLGEFCQSLEAWINREKRSEGLVYDYEQTLMKRAWAFAQDIARGERYTALLKPLEPYLKAYGLSQDEREGEGEAEER